MYLVLGSAYVFYSISGAFLVPYAIMLLICGFPIFFFELAIGQFASEGPITVWKVNPLFYGKHFHVKFIQANTRYTYAS